jgi:hypothetical protein
MLTGADPLAMQDMRAGSAQAPRRRGPASVGDVFDTLSLPDQRTYDAGVGDMSSASEPDATPEIPATLDTATVERLLEAVGRGWVPANLQELLQHGCPRDLLLALWVLAQRERVDPSVAAVLWLALLVQSVEPQRLDPPASPRYLEVLGERQWRALRRAYREQVGRLLAA